MGGYGRADTRQVKSKEPARASKEKHKRYEQNGTNGGKTNKTAAAQVSQKQAYEALRPYTLIPLYTYTLIPLHPSTLVPLYPYTRAPQKRYEQNGTNGGKTNKTAAAQVSRKH